MSYLEVHSGQHKLWIPASYNYSSLNNLQLKITIISKNKNKNEQREKETIEMIPQFIKYSQ